MKQMKIKVWHIMAAWGAILLVGTIGAADMGAISSVRIVLQVVTGIALVIGSYISFIVCCNKWCRERWSKYDRH